METQGRTSGLHPQSETAKMGTLSQRMGGDCLYAESDLWRGLQNGCGGTDTQGRKLLGGGARAGSEAQAAVRMEGALAEGKPFHDRGRPPRPQRTPVEAKAEGDAKQQQQTQQRIAELERLLGKQAAMLDFFEQALQQVEDLHPKPAGGSASSPSSGSDTEPAGKAR